MERLRCNACGEVFTAEEPESAGADKYDETAVAMIALLKYGTGVPFNRLEGLQEHLGMPLLTTTQWDLMAAAAKLLWPVLVELILRQAAQGSVMHNDDIGMRGFCAWHANRATSGRGRSPAVSYRWSAHGPSHCSSPDGSMRARTSPRC